MIGILAGMGPKSTGPFIDQVVSSFQEMTGAKNDIDFPPMMIYSLPTPFYVDRPLDHGLMEKAICAGLKKLEACGVSFIAMPCNVAHLYFSKLQQCLQVPLLNIVEATLESFSTSNCCIAILGTCQTLESGIYQKRIGCQYNVAIDSSWQKKVDELLISIKTSPDFERPFHLWEDLSQSLQRAKVDTIILACTDLNVLFKKIHAPFQIVDSSACLAEAIVRKWKSLRV